jgi:hypothetical protein
MAKKRSGGTDGQIPVTEYVARFAPDVRRLIQEARRTVKLVAGTVDEKAYRGWPIRIGTDRGLVAIAGFRDHVNVNFGHGASLRDPNGLLQGTGKSIRHVKLRSVADARSDALRDLVRQELVEAPVRMTITRAEIDRILARLRRVCLKLPETSERLSHGAPTFFYRDKKQFVTVLTDFHQDGRFAIWCAAPSGAQPALVKADPDRFFVPPYVGHRGWLGVRLDRRIDWDELSRIVEDAYAEVAPGRASQHAPHQGSRRA